MHDDKWTESEKKVARRVFETALQAELAETIETFKAKAAAISAPDDMWPLKDFLLKHQREIDAKYEFRYSRLILLFAQLLREHRITVAQLHGLSDDKLALIRQIGTS